MGMRIREFVKYVICGSFNRADTIASTAGAVVLLIIVHFVGIGGNKMLSADEFTRSIEISLIGFTAIWLAIMVWRACWWPFHWRLEPYGGLIPFLRGTLGAFMWPVILTASGFLAFVFLSGIGAIWLSLQVLNGTPAIKTIDSLNTVGNPDFTLLVPDGRYRFTWPGTNLMTFYLRLDSEKNPNISNSPAFILRNRTNTVAYRVSATWKSETSLDIERLVKSSSKLSKANFILNEYSLVITPISMQLRNVVYYLDPSPKQLIKVVAKEEEVYLPTQLWPLVAVYLTDKTPNGIGETSPPFVAIVTLNWETSEGKRQKSYRVRITATNAKSSSSPLPIIDAYLNFSIEEIAQ